MRKWGLFWKLFLAFALLSVVTAVLYGVLAIPGLADDEEREAERALTAAAGMLAEWARPVLAGTTAPEQLQERLAALGPDRTLRLTVVDPSGVVLADTHYDPVSMGNHAGRPELVEARKVGRGRAARPSATLGLRLLYVARRVDEDGKVLGYARASQSLAAVDERKTRLVAVLATSAIGATLASVVLAFFVSRRLTKPLRSIAEAAVAVAHGKYDRRIPMEGQDEIGRLAATFNRMARELRDRIETISRDRTELLAMLSAMAEGVVAVDADERVVLMNDAAGRLLGVEPDKAVGRRIWEVTRVSAVGEVLVSAIGRGESEAREATLASQARERHLQLLAAPVRMRDGTVQGAVLVLHDITELRHLEKVRRDFVANVSHELKTPLAAIRGFAETILEDPEMDPEVRRRFVDRIRHQTVRLGQLVEEVLALSRLESEADAVARVPVDPRPVVAEVIQNFQPLAAERGIHLEVHVDPEPLAIRGDAEGLRRVASNLIDNAVKYTPSGGTVKLRLEGRGERVRLQVDDTGGGIPPEARERVFERFYRVDPGRSRQAGGTGLGLSIVKHLVLAMRGRVWAEAAPSGGSRFIVELPSGRASPGQRDGGVTRKTT